MASTVWRRLAKAAVRLYPEAWRARYEEEVVALLDATKPGAAVVADLLRGAVRERSGVAESVLSFVMIFVRAFIWTWVAVLATWLVFLVVVGPLLLLGTGFALGDWPAWMIRRLRETPYLGVHPFLLLWSTAVSLPAWLVLRVSGMGRRWPKTSRVLYVSAFMWFSLWLMGLNLVSVPLAFAGCLIAPLISFGVFLAAFLGFAFIWGDGAAFAQMLLVGSMIAARLLPRGSCAHPPPADAAGATPIEVTSDADTADVRLRMVLTS